MSDPVQLSFTLTTTSGPQENFVKFLFAAFLNTGIIDNLMRTTTLKYKSFNDKHVGEAFLIVHIEKTREEFFAWINKEPLAQFAVKAMGGMGGIGGIGNSLKRDPDGGLNVCGPYCTMLGQRVKIVCELLRARMPKDLAKSFFTKSRTHLQKFIKEWSSPGGFAGTQSQNYSVEAWLKYVLTGQSDNIPQSDQYLSCYARDLNAIKRLYDKTMALKEAPLDDVVKQLLDEALIASVQLS